MPKVFEYKKYKFFFFSNEGAPIEPCHIHVRKDEKLCKFWISEKAILAENYGFSPAVLNELRQVANENIEKIKGAWNEHFGK